MALTATAWTQVILPTAGSPSMGPPPNRFRIENKTRVVRVRMELTNASDGAAYPTSGGIPLPSFTPTDGYSWGMVRNLDYVVMYGQGHTASGLATSRPVFHYAPTSHSIIGLESNFTLVNPSAGATTIRGLQELTTEWTPSLAPYNTVLYFEARGW